MKPQHLAVVAVGMLLVALFLLFGWRPQPTSTPRAVTSPPTRLVTVTGEGEVRVRPDSALIPVTIVTVVPSPTEAEATNGVIWGRVRTAMVAAGVDKNLLEVVGPTISRDSSFGWETVVATRSVVATVRDLSKVPAVIDAAMSAGAAGAGPATYALDNPDQSKESAMRAALENARQLAAAVVKAEGGRLGELQSMEFLSSEITPDGSSATSIPVRVKVRATFSY